MMEASEFIRLAEPDRSTALDEIGDILGPGCTPDIELSVRCNIVVRML